MTETDPDVIVSRLSREVTLDGVTVQVHIFRRKQVPRWALEVVSDGGMATLWNEEFETETKALAAFHKAVRDEGMSIFLDDGAHRTIH